MTDDQRKNDGEVSLETHANAAGELKVTAKLPVPLLNAIGHRFTQATAFVTAGVLPTFYDRAHQVVSRAKVRDALVERLCSNIEKTKDEEWFVDAITDATITHAERLERKRIISTQATQELLQYSPDSAADATMQMDEGFLSHFWDVAASISEVHMQDLFASILAGEIVSPGKFSAATINLLPTLHPALAKKFESFCNMSFKFDNLAFVMIGMPHGEKPTTGYNSLGTNRVMGEQLAEYGLTREDLLELRSVGLTRSMPEEEYPDLSDFYATGRVEFGGEWVQCRIGADAPLSQEGVPGTAHATNVISLTRIGFELRQVLTLEQHGKYRNDLEEIMKIAKVVMRNVQPTKG